MGEREGTFIGERWVWESVTGLAEECRGEGCCEGKLGVAGALKSRRGFEGAFGVAELEA